MTPEVHKGIDCTRSPLGELRNASTNFLSALQKFDHLLPNGRISIGDVTVSAYGALVMAKRISSGTFIIHSGESEVIFDEVPGAGVRSMVVNGASVVADGKIIDSPNGVELGCTIIKNAAIRLNERFAQLLQSIGSNVSCEARAVMQLHP